MGWSCIRRCFRREYPNPKSSISVLFRTVRGSCVVMIGGLFGRVSHDFSHGLGSTTCVAVSIFVGVGNVCDILAPSAWVCGCIQVAFPSGLVTEIFKVNVCVKSGYYIDAQIEQGSLFPLPQGQHMPQPGYEP